MNKLAKDIEEDPNFLYQRPPLINLIKGEYICYAGTQRIKAAQLNGNAEIYCLIEENVPKRIQNKRMLIDNLHRGKWDEDKLLDLDFDLLELKELGFKDFEISLFDNDDKEEPIDFSDSIEMQYKVEIDCVDEKDQETLFNRLTEEGYVCRVLTL